MLTSALPLVFLIAAIVVLGARGNLYSSSPTLAAAQVVAIGLNLRARRSFPKDTFRVTAAPGGDAIIRHGPYRFIRHPMYSAVLLFVWAAVRGHLSRFTLATGAVVTGAGIARVIAEERLLRDQLPGYQDYAQDTKALVPYLL